MKNFYGYMRVSTKEHNEDRQAEGIAAARQSGMCRSTFWAKVSR